MPQQRRHILPPRETRSAHDFGHAMAAALEVEAHSGADAAAAWFHAHEQLPSHDAAKCPMTVLDSAGGAAAS